MFYFRMFIALLLLSAAACGESTLESTDQAETSDWWDTDETATDTTAPADTESDTSDKPDTGDKPEGDGDKPDQDSTEVDSWAGEIDTDMGTGTLTYTKSTASGEDCQLSYPVTDVSSLENCTECSFAWDLSLGDVEITLDAGGCGDYALLSDQSLKYGQGTVTVGEYAGTTYYELYQSEDGDSWSPNGGYSSVAGSTWSFGNK